MKIPEDSDMARLLVFLMGAGYSHQKSVTYKERTYLMKEGASNFSESAESSDHWLIMTVWGCAFFFDQVGALTRQDHLN